MSRRVIVVEGKHDLLVVKTLCKYFCDVDSTTYYDDPKSLYNIYDKRSPNFDLVRRMMKKYHSISILYADSGKYKIINNIAEKLYSLMNTGDKVLFVFDQDPANPTEQIINKLSNQELKQWIEGNMYLIEPSMEDIVKLADKEFADFFNRNSEDFYNLLVNNQCLESFTELVSKLKSLFEND